jgi:hypothetical protein
MLHESVVPRNAAKPSASRSKTPHGSRNAKTTKTARPTIGATIIPNSTRNARPMAFIMNPWI